MKKLGFLLLALTVLVSAAPVGAQDDDVIYKGLDVWYTPAGGGNVTVDIPAGFFCRGNSDPQTRTISLQGRPLVTSPVGALHPGDTVVDREEDIPFDEDEGLTGTGSVRIRALDLVGTQSFTVLCPESLTEVWNTEVSLDGEQERGTIVIRRESRNAEDGRFDASFPVKAKIRFVNAANGDTTAALSREDTIATLDACWANRPGEGGIEWPDAVKLDTDGDRDVDYLSRYGTSNFFPGWKIVDNKPVQCPVGHPGGPHPTTCGGKGDGCREDKPTNPCTSSVLEYLRKVQVSGGFRLGSVSALDAMFSTGAGKAQGKAAVNRDYLGSVRVDRCIQVEGTEILKNKKKK